MSRVTVGGRNEETYRVLENEEKGGGFEMMKFEEKLCEIRRPASKEDVTKSMDFTCYGAHGHDG